MVKRIDQLEHSVNPLDIGKRLDGNLKGSFSTRVGKIRVVFKVVHERKQIEVQRIQYRGKDYKP